MTTTTPTADPHPRRVSVSVPLDRDTEYAALRRACDRMAAALGRPRVAGADVIRALVAELDRDTALAERVTAAVATRTGDARRPAAA
jgi:hypothetical protein